MITTGEFQSIFNEIVTRAKQTESLTFATSIGFRHRLFELVCGSDIPGPVIELGCYMGGSSVFLAQACAIAGRELFIIDISQDFIDMTLDHIQRVVGKAPVRAFHGTAEDFAESALGRGTLSPFLVFIDADHRYDAVRRDIQAMGSLERQPVYWAFHDYSLRGTVDHRTDIAVDKAIHDEFGEISPIERIGLQTFEATAPNYGGDYFAAAGSEGVLFKSAAAARRPSTVGSAIAAVPSLKLSDRASYFYDRFSGIDTYLAVNIRNACIADREMSLFMSRWYVNGVPSILRLQEIMTSDNLRPAYFEDFRALIDSLTEEERSLIYSTKAVFKADSILNNPFLNAIGLCSFRACVIRDAIKENRRKAVAKLLRSGSLSPQTPAETQRLFSDLEFFDQNGFIVLSMEPGTTAKALAAELCDDTIMCQKYLTKVDGDTLLYRMPLSSKLTPEAMSIVNNKRFLTLYSMICGHPIRPIPAYSEFIHQGGGDQKQVDANKLWHIDSFHNTFKWWCFFDGVKMELGPFMYYKGSNTLDGPKLLWLAVYGLFNALNVKTGDVSISPRITSEDIKFFGYGKPEVFDVPPLTLVIADTFGIHRRSEPDVPGLIRRSFFGWARHELV